MRLRSAMTGKKVELTDSLGVDADWLEAFAFAWLAKQAIANCPSSWQCYRCKRTKGAWRDLSSVAAIQAGAVTSPCRLSF